jgi:low affinity Fe/Cu permease
MQIKLDELIRAVDQAHNALLDLEELDEKDLAKFRERYEKLAREARDDLRDAHREIDLPSIEQQRKK